MKKNYSIKASVWLYEGKDPWHFVSIPKKETEEINYYFSHVKRGWGSLPVIVTLGETTWKTSIFSDKKTDTYLLPLKIEIRKKENIKEGDEINFSIEINT